MAIENYCIDCKAVAEPNCEQRGHIVGTLGEGGSSEWCDDCHGYTHMPYCPSYKEVKPDTTTNQSHEPERMAEQVNPFQTAWANAPRYRRDHVEKEDAEYWFKYGQRSVLGIVKDDLEEIHRLVSGRIEG